MMMTEYDRRDFALTEHLRNIQIRMNAGRYDTMLCSVDELIEYLYCDTIKRDDIFKYDSDGEPINDEELTYWREVFNKWCELFIFQRKLRNEH